MATHHPTTSRSSAGPVSPMVRRTDKTETQMLLEVVTGAVEHAGITRAEVDFTCAGQLRLRRRPGVLVRAEHRRHRRLAAEARLARRDGRRVGAVRGVGAAAARRHRRRAWPWARAGRRPPTPTLIYPMEMDPYYLAPLGHRRDVASPRCRPGRCSTRARSPSARWPRSRPGPGVTRKDNPNAQVSGDFDVDDAARRGLRARRRCAATTSRRSPTARARS